MKKKASNYSLNFYT